MKCHVFFCESCQARCTVLFDLRIIYGGVPACQHTWKEIKDWEEEHGLEKGE